ncbi:hypothetical protein G6F66_015436 [Rhizopus arrhizus]|nr:hypothetical protein G6F66_015436 [Rhizopus arrhizus]
MGNMNVSMFEAVKYALDKGVPVVISTRVPNGRTMPVYGFPGGGKTTFDAGAVMAGDLSPQKARHSLPPVRGLYRRWQLDPAREGRPRI